MPYKWTVEQERLMLLLAISSLDVTPKAETWSTVARLLGNGLTTSAVQQKFYKLKNGSPLLNDDPTALSPKKAKKRKAADEEDVKPERSKKRTGPAGGGHSDMGAFMGFADIGDQQGFEVESSVGSYEFGSSQTSGSSAEWDEGHVKKE